MNYEEAIDYIGLELKGGCNPGLKRIEILLGLLGNPHKELKAVHVAGTNGKGSVTAMLSSILNKAGYKVGTYISPHLISITERYLINGKQIDKSSFTRYTEILKEKIEYIKKMGEEIPSQFEMLTALAFLYFRDEKVDIAVVEVGLGGRYDATNVLDSMISIITSISYDHIAILGDSIEEIAMEKAGIIKNKGLTILYPQKYAEAEKAIESKCIKLESNLIKVEKESIVSKEFNIDGQLMDYYYNNFMYRDIKLPLLGDHQLLNAAVAITAASSLNKFGFKVDEHHIRQGIENVVWPCRLSVASINPLIIIDGAHNEDGVLVLSMALKKYFKGKELILVMGMLKDKDHDKSLEILASMAKNLIATEPLNERALKAEELGREAKKYCLDVKIEPSLKNAIEAAMSICNNNSFICICGSLYLVGEAYKIIKKEFY